MSSSSWMDTTQDSEVDGTFSQLSEKGKGKGKERTQQQHDIDVFTRRKIEGKMEAPVDGVNPLGVLGLGFLGGARRGSATSQSQSCGTSSYRGIELQPLDFDLDIESLTLSQVLKGGPLQKLYGTFLDEKMCKEEYLFWLAIQRYKENGSEEKGCDRADFLLIVNEFLDPNSLLESAVSGQNAQPLLLEAEQGFGRRPPYDIFDSAQLDLWVSMQTETFPKFKASDLLSDFVESRAVGDDIFFKRRKLEDFFGMAITGKIKRCELITIVSTAPITKVEKKKQMKSKGFTGFSFWGDKRKNMKRRHKSYASPRPSHPKTHGRGKKNKNLKSDQHVSQQPPPQQSSPQQPSPQQRPEPNFGGVPHGGVVNINSLISPSTSSLAGTSSTPSFPSPSPRTGENNSERATTPDPQHKDNQHRRRIASVKEKELNSHSTNNNNTAHSSTPLASNVSEELIPKKFTSSSPDVSVGEEEEKEKEKEKEKEREKEKGTGGWGKRPSPQRGKGKGSPFKEKFGEEEREMGYI